jgi:hypothetical protein
MRFIDRKKFDFRQNTWYCTRCKTKNNERVYLWEIYSKKTRSYFSYSNCEPCKIELYVDIYKNYKETLILTPWKEKIHNFFFYRSRIINQIIEYPFYYLLNYTDDDFIYINNY